jgi:hypothetical protein
MLPDLHAASASFTSEAAFVMSARGAWAVVMDPAPVRGDCDILVTARRLDGLVAHEETGHPGCRGATARPGYRAATARPGCREETGHPGCRGATARPGCHEETGHPGCRGATARPGCHGATVRPGSNARRPGTAEPESPGLTDAVFLLSMSFAWATSAGQLVCAAPIAGDNDSATATLRTAAKSFFMSSSLSLLLSAPVSARPARLHTEPGAST